MCIVMAQKARSSKQKAPSLRTRILKMQGAVECLESIQEWSSASLVEIDADTVASCLEGTKKALEKLKRLKGDRTCSRPGVGAVTGS